VTVLLNYHIGSFVLGSMFVGDSVWLGWSGIRVQASACNTDTTPTQPHLISNKHRTKNNTANVAIQQHSRKLLMMGIVVPETCWAHKKWNKITSGIKLVFYSSTITMMHGPINIRNFSFLKKYIFIPKPLFLFRSHSKAPIFKEIHFIWRFTRLILSAEMIIYSQNMKMLYCSRKG